MFAKKLIPAHTQSNEITNSPFSGCCSLFNTWWNIWISGWTVFHF